MEYPSNTNQQTLQDEQEQTMNKEFCIKVLKEIKKEFDAKIQKNKQKVFKEYYQLFSKDDMESFKEVVIESSKNKFNISQKIMKKVCQNFQITQKNLDNFLMQNEKDPQVEECFQALFNTQNDNLQLSDIDITEDQMDEILRFAADQFDKYERDQTWGKGEEAYILVEAQIQCQIYQKFQKTDSEFEKGILYWFKNNPNKYQWYQTRVEAALNKIF